MPSFFTHKEGGTPPRSGLPAEHSEALSTPVNLRRIQMVNLSTPRQQAWLFSQHHAIIPVPCASFPPHSCNCSLPSLPLTSAPTYRLSPATFSPRLHDAPEETRSDESFHTGCIFLFTLTYWWGWWWWWGVKMEFD